MIKFDKNGKEEIAHITIKPEKIICPDCGGLTTEGLVFCELCGAELETMEAEEYTALKDKFGELL